MSFKLESPDFVEFYSSFWPLAVFSITHYRGSNRGELRSVLAVPFTAGPLGTNTTWSTPKWFQVSSARSSLLWLIQQQPPSCSSCYLEVSTLDTCVVTYIKIHFATAKWGPSKTWKVQFRFFIFFFLLVSSFKKCIALVYFLNTDWCYMFLKA